MAAAAAIQSADIRCQHAAHLLTRYRRARASSTFTAITVRLARDDALLAGSIGFRLLRMLYNDSSVLLPMPPLKMPAVPWLTYVLRRLR